MKNNSNYSRILICQFCVICLILILAVPAAAEDEAFGEYFSATRPGPKDKPTPVSIGIAVVDIDSIDGANQSFKANFVISMHWEDPRLAKTTSALRKLDLKEVWNPSLQIVNQQKLFKTFPETVEISPEGTVIYRQRYWGTLSNPMNLREFPFDHHSLRIELVSAGDTTDDIKFVIVDDRTGLGARLTVTDWKIVGWEASSEVIRIGKGLPVFPGAIFEFEAKRLVGFYLIKVLLPLVMIIFMSLIILFIDPVHVGPKFSIAITAMLTLIAYRFLLGNLLPRISYLTRMDYFLFGSTFLVFAVLVETAIAAHLTGLKKERLAKKVDYWSRWIFVVLFLIIIVGSFYPYL